MSNRPRVWAEIDLDAISHNLALLRARLPERARVMLVVKADAYGHGAIEVARHVLARGEAHAFGVGDSEEALELREAGIDAPLLILGAIVDGEMAAVIRNDIAVCAHSLSRVKRLDWSWRAIKLPHQADECSPKKGDSPAVLYVTWKRMLRWYSLKYVWSATRPPGTVCDRRRNPFVAQDTIVLRSGGPLGVWQHESIDLAREFRAHFEDGDQSADVPDLIGIAVMTDGDQTKTESTGDYADFVFTY